MRRNNLSFIILFGLLFATFITSCESEVEVPDGFKPSTNLFKVLSDTIFIDGLSSDGSNTVTSTFTVTSSSSWFLETAAWGDLHATPDHDNGTVTIRTSENETPNERKGTLTITTGEGLHKTLTLLQRPGKIELEITPPNLRFGINGGSTKVTINCNTAWTLTGGTPWCTVSTTKGEAGTTTVTFNAEATNDTEREAVFAVTPAGSTTSKSIKVKQDTKTTVLAVSQSGMITFNATAGQENTFVVTSNEEWEAVVSDDCDWVEVTPAIGGTSSTSTTVTVKCVKSNYTGSERVGAVTIRCYGLEKTIPVRQRNTDINFNVTLSELTTDGSQQTLTVVSSTTWRVMCNQAWCHLAPEGQNDGNGQYNGNGRVLLTFDENTTGQSRTAYITFEPTDLNPVTITVTQRAGEPNPGRQPGEDDNGRPNPSRQQ